MGRPNKTEIYVWFGRCLRFLKVLSRSYYGVFITWILQGRTMEIEVHVSNVFMAETFLKTDLWESMTCGSICEARSVQRPSCWSWPTVPRKWLKLAWNEWCTARVFRVAVHCAHSPVYGRAALKQDSISAPVGGTQPWGVPMPSAAVPKPALLDCRGIVFC